MKRKNKTNDGYLVLAITGFIFFFLFVNYAPAEILQAPLVFEYINLKGPQIFESEPVRTSGTIKAIACSWNFEGKVTLEASANNGVAYTKIINGSILKEGFIPGNELRFKAVIAENSILKRVVLGYADSSGVSRILVNPELAGFKYQKALYVSPAQEELFNYPLMLRLDRNKDLAGNVENDYRDVRFIAADGASPLDYYYEGADIFWVRIPQIPKEGLSLYLYYSNPQAGHNSSPGKVFEFYDDFNAAKLDEAKWQKSLGLKGEATLKDGYLQLRDAAILSREFKIQDGILEFKAKAEENAAIQGMAQQPQVDGYFREVFYSSAYPGAEHTIAINDVAKLNIGKPIQAQTDYIYKVIMNGAGAIFERYSKDYEKQVQLQFLDTALSGPGFIGLKADASFMGEGKVYYDWMRARPYAKEEPKLGVKNE